MSSGSLGALRSSVKNSAARPKFFSRCYPCLLIELTYVSSHITALLGSLLLNMVWSPTQRFLPHFCNMLIISLFTNNCLAHCKTYVLLRGSSDVLLPKAATALTTKITVTGKAGITFYWADHTFALRLS